MISFRIALYSSARFTCRSRETIWRFTSAMMSWIRRRFCCVASIFIKASLFFSLYFAIPAASSMRNRRSWGLALIRYSTRPCSMIEYPSTPMPESRNRSVMSRSRQGTLLMRYSLSPDRKSLRVTVISLYSEYSLGRFPFSLVKVRFTSAMPRGFRPSVPPKITSSISFPRRCLALRSPMAQRMESTTLDFPHPFGPTIAVIPSGKGSWVRSTKDLNPIISSDLSFIEHPLERYCKSRCSKLKC